MLPLLPCAPPGVNAKAGSHRRVFVRHFTGNADGTSTVTTQTGATLVVQGTGVAAGSAAFVRDGAMGGEAPDLPTYTETV